MAGYDLLLLVGFFIGAVFYGALLFEVIRRFNRLYHEYVFILLILVLGLWHGFQFLALVIKQIFGRPAIEIYSEIRYYALYSIVFFPPLIVHLHSSFLGYIRSLIGKKSFFHKWTPLLMYLPIVAIIYIGQYTIIDYRKRILDENLSFIPYFVFFTVICLWISALLSVWIILINRNEKWRQFFIVEAVCLVMISALLMYFYFYGGTGNVRLDKSLRTLVIVSSILPTGALIYLLYKYPFFSLFARPGFLSLIIAGIYLCVYIIVSKEIQKAGEDNPGISVYVLETLLVCLLFITYEPVKNFIRRVAGAKALGERYVVQTLLRSVSEKIVGTDRMSDILQVIREPIQSALRVNEIALFIIAQDYENQKDYVIAQQYGDVKPFNLKKTVKGILQGKGIHEPRKIYTFHLTSMDVSYQIYTGIFLENTLTGFIAIGKKINNDNFTFEEKELLLALANQVSIAIENMESSKRRMELESRILEAEKLSALGMLSTSIAHEVKNPLSSIKSIVQSMIDEQEKKPDSPETAQDLAMINEEINRLASVVDQLLRFAKSERTEDAVTDLRKTVETILSILRHEMGRHQIAVMCDFPEQPLCARFSYGHLKEIIFNLIINAIQSMGESGGRLYIHASLLNRSAEFLDEAGYEVIDGVYYSEIMESESSLSRYPVWSYEPFVAAKIDQLNLSVTDAGTEPGNKLLRIMIRDTGPGITRSLIHEIFKPFYTTKATGTGMGLAIVKNKTELLGGRLLIKTKENEGSAFEIYIPIHS